MYTCLYSSSLKFVIEITANYANETLIILYCVIKSYVIKIVILIVLMVVGIKAHIAFVCL